MAKRRNGPVETVEPAKFTGKTDPTGSFFLGPIRTLTSLQLCLKNVGYIAIGTAREALFF